MRFLSSARPWVLGLSVGGQACSAVPNAARPVAPALAPDRVVVPRMIVTPQRVMSIDDLFERAQADFAAKLFDAAAAGYARVYELDPEGPHAEDALFFAGTAQDLDGEQVAALRSYEAYIGRFSGAARARTALVRSARLYAFLEQWEQAGLSADQALARYTSLRPFELIALYGAKSLALLAKERDTEASYYVEKARTIIEAQRLDAAGEIPRDLAQIYYALGEIRRMRAERIKFVPVPTDFARALEQRCQLILDAQSSYSDTMRAHDAHWSAMAGFRVGQLYQRLHEDLMLVPPPATADTLPREQLFEGAMRLRYSILLEKAHSMLEHTLRMAERTEERSAWVGRAQSALVDLNEAMQREQAALAALPFSRQELQRALDELGRQKSGP